MIKAWIPHSSCCNVQRFGPSEPTWVQGDARFDDELWFSCNDTLCSGRLYVTLEGLDAYHVFASTFIEQLHKDGQRGSPTIDEQDPT